MTRWWFQIFVIFTPAWGRFPFWRAYFSDGLKPPIRCSDPKSSGTDGPPKFRGTLVQSLCHLACRGPPDAWWLPMWVAIENENSRDFEKVGLVILCMFFLFFWKDDLEWFTYIRCLMNLLMMFLYIYICMCHWYRLKRKLLRLWIFLHVYRMSALWIFPGHQRRRCWCKGIGLSV